MDSTSIVPTSPPAIVQIDLATIARQIAQEHNACSAAARQSIHHAMRCGDLLFKAKGECRHGNWSKWLAENFPGSSRTAQVYMRLANHRSAIEAKNAVTADLTIDEAVRLISPRPVHAKRLAMMEVVERAISLIPTEALSVEGESYIEAIAAAKEAAEKWEKFEVWATRDVFEASTHIEQGQILYACKRFLDKWQLWQQQLDSFVRHCIDRLGPAVDAFREIRDRALHRETHNKFTDYCREVHGVTAKWVNEQIRLVAWAREVSQ